MRGVHYLVMTLVGFAFTFTFTANAAAQRLVPESGEKRTIVVDPGHGGHDHGAQGPAGTLEKDIVLRLAHTIAAEFRGKHRVLLTRADDYRLNIPDRTAVANSSGADVLISLHTGSSFLYQGGGVTIFYYDKPQGASLVQAGDLIEPPDPATGPILWETVQAGHKRMSKILAKSLYDYMSRNGDPTQVKIQSAPLVVLEGADAPAVLLEISCLSNPLEEKRLRDVSVLAELANQICDGIDDFLLKSRKEP